LKIYSVFFDPRVFSQAFFLNRSQIGLIAWKEDSFLNLRRSLGESSIFFSLSLNASAPPQKLGSFLELRRTHSYQGDLLLPIIRSSTSPIFLIILG